MKMRIDQIKVSESERVRIDPGDLASLTESISAMGLLNPILVDESGRLVAGFRRLGACRRLGWEEAEVTVLPFRGDELKMLEAEAAENLFRKDFTPEEIARIEERRQEILRRLRGNIFQRFWRLLRRVWRGIFRPRKEK